jgi:hypothetical protein
MRLILAFLCATVASWAQYPVNGGLGGGGGGFTAPSGYSATVTGLTTLTVTAAQHGQGPAPTAWCFDNAAPALAVSCSYTVSSIGDVVFTWSPAFTGYILIRGPGASAGAAGDVVGPSSSTSGCVAYFSGTSGKIITCAPTGLFYDAANVRLGVGTGSPGVPVEVIGPAAADAAVRIRRSSTSYYATLDLANTGSFSAANILWQIGKSPGSEQFRFRTWNGAVNVDALAIANVTGNLLLGGTTDGNYKLDVQASGSTGTLRAFNQAVGGSTLVVVQAGDTQSGNLLSVRNNAGTQLSYIDSAGSVFGAGVFTTGTNSIGSSSLGQFNFLSDGVVRIANTTATDFNRLQFGGTTSSFPALKRSSATLQVRLADDSAFATLDMGIPKFSGTNSTGAGSALLGANSPASTLTAPYTWITVVTSDGSTAYIPAWK